MQKQDDIEKLNFEEIEKYGASDYYLSLLSYVNNFVNRNYPLDIQQIRDIVNEKEFDAVTEREFAFDNMYRSVIDLTKAKMESNKEFLSKLNKGEYVKATSVEQEQETFNKSVQYILEQLSNSKNERTGRITR